MPGDPVLIRLKAEWYRLKAEWYRNGMHDIAQTRTQNGVPPLTKAEIRENVAGFSRVLFSMIDPKLPTAGPMSDLNAEELRKALDNAVIYDKRPAMGSAESNNARTRSLIEAAARSWLSLLEDDEATVEKVATVICRIDNQTGPDVAVEGVPCDLHRSVARAVLAAITEGEA